MEIRELAQRAYGHELVLRAMTAAMSPEQRAPLALAIEMYRDISLFGLTADTDIEAITAVALRIVNGPTTPSAAR